MSAGAASDEVGSDHSDRGSNSSGAFGGNVCYGRELWDCLPIIEESTAERTQNMRCLKTFFNQFKVAIDNFGMHMSKAVT